MTDLPPLRDIPIGLTDSTPRTEFDSLGTVEVPGDKYWGAQTQRCLVNFAISDERMPMAVVHRYGVIKRAAAMANAELSTLAPEMATAISAAAAEVSSGSLDEHFPLLIWQSGSGTPTNMNVNEVISNRAIQLLGGELGSQQPIAPNQHVNMSQSTNDTFVTAMHMALYSTISQRTIPQLQQLHAELERKAHQWRDEVKIGRTHLQDATPITVGQEWSGFAASVADALAALDSASESLLELAIGGTAVGTGLNAPRGFDQHVVGLIAALTGDPYRAAANHFAAQSTLNAIVRTHGALKYVATVLFKLANDLRWLGSGPHTGLAELIFPSNEPGSSIMPGKVNPTQAEVVMMVCTQVFGADVTVTTAGSEGNLQLNVFRPVVIDAALRSARTLGDAAGALSSRMIEGSKLNAEVLTGNVESSVMLVTALAPVIGYHEAAAIAHAAVAEKITLREAALAAGVTLEQFEEIVDVIAMTKPTEAG